MISVVLVLVEAHVGEELARPVVAEGRVGERVAGVGAGAGLDLVGVDRDRARGDPGRAGDHPLPAVLDRLDAPVVEAQVGLVVHAVQALHDRLLELVDDLGALAGSGIDAVDALVVDLHLEVRRPAAVAAQPAADVHGTLHPPKCRLRPMGEPVLGRRPRAAPRGRRQGDARRSRAARRSRGRWPRRGTWPARRPHSRQSLTRVRGSTPRRSPRSAASTGSSPSGWSARRPLPGPRAPARGGAAALGDRRGRLRRASAARAARPRLGVREPAAACARGRRARRGRGRSAGPPRPHRALTAAGRRERAVLDRASDELAASFLAPLNARQRERLVGRDGRGRAAADRRPGRDRGRRPRGPGRALLPRRVLRPSWTAASTPGSISPAASPPMRREMRAAGRRVPRRHAARRAGRLRRAQAARRRAGRAQAHVGAPTARGLGVGRRLLGELEARAAGRAAATWCASRRTAALTEAIALYRSAGYAEVPPFNDEPYAHHWFEKRLRGERLSRRSRDIVRSGWTKPGSLTRCLSSLRQTGVADELARARRRSRPRAAARAGRSRAARTGRCAGARRRSGGCGRSRRRTARRPG